MKRFYSVLLVILVAAALAVVIYQQEKPQPVVIIIDGVEVQFEQDPLLENGVLLAEAGPLFEKLGLKYAFHSERGTISAYNEKQKMNLQLGSSDYIVNDLNFKLPAPPRLVKDVPYVPVRLIAEFTDKVVFWDQGTKTVKICSWCGGRR